MKMRRLGLIFMLCGREILLPTGIWNFGDDRRDGDNDIERRGRSVGEAVWSLGEAIFIVGIRAVSVGAKDAVFW